jgi:hypothetical protein
MLLFGMNEQGRKKQHATNRCLPGCVLLLNHNITRKACDCKQGIFSLWLYILIHMKSSRLLLVFCFVIGSLTNHAQLKSGKVYKWAGTIGKTTAASGWFAEQDSIIVGAITYKKTGQPIPLRGVRIDSTEYRIQEFGNQGTVSGILTGTLNKNVFSGQWFSPKTRREHTLRLHLQQPLAAPKPLLSPVRNFSGTYQYNYTEEGPQGQLTVQRRGDSAVIAFDNVTAAPAYNQATIEPVTVAVLGTQIIYRMQESCVIRIRFYNDIAVVDYLHDASDCLFGMNATVYGVYLKTGK